MFAFGLSWVMFLVVVGGVDYPSSVSMVCGKRLGKNADDFGGGVSLGVKKTNFLVSLHTVPALLACDERTGGGGRKHIQFLMSISLVRCAFLGRIYRSGER